jgi:hypothetical protein
MLFLVTAISWVFGRAFARDSTWQRANLAPPLGALFDYLENLSTSLVMLRNPARTPVVDVLAPVFTALKRASSERVSSCCSAESSWQLGAGRGRGHGAEGLARANKGKDSFVHPQKRIVLTIPKLSLWERPRVPPELFLLTHPTYIELVFTSDSS